MATRTSTKLASTAIRRSVALPRRVVDDLTAVRELRDPAFTKAMAEMAADPAIQKQCAAIQREFVVTVADGLHDD